MNESHTQFEANYFRQQHNVYETSHRENYVVSKERKNSSLCFANVLSICLLCKAGMKYHISFAVGLTSMKITEG